MVFSIDLTLTKEIHVNKLVQALSLQDLLNRLWCQTCQGSYRFTVNPHATHKITLVMEGPQSEQVPFWFFNKLEYSLNWTRGTEGTISGYHIHYDQKKLVYPSIYQ